jgi:hypothetical protein
MLDSFDKPISKPSLFLSGVRAYLTFDTTLGHFLIFFGYGSCWHLHSPELNWARQSPTAAKWASINFFLPVIPVVDALQGTSAGIQNTTKRGSSIAIIKNN